MKPLLLFTLMAIAVGGCTYVEQSINKDESKFLCPSGQCIETFAWYKGDIVWSSYDDLESSPDSIKIIRRKQAKAILKKIKL